MGKLAWILILGFFGSIIAAQGFERKIGNQDQATGIYNIERLSKNEIVLNLSYVFSGVGSNSLSSTKALYYPLKDSLGPVMNWVYYSNALTYHYQQYLRLDSTQWLSLSHEAQFPGFTEYRYINLRGTGGNFSFQYWPLAFNIIQLGDTLLGLRSTADYWDWRSQMRPAQDTIIVIQINPGQQSFTDLDTLIVPDSLQVPGTWFYDKGKQQFEYFNDSLAYYFKLGQKGVFDSIVDYRGSFYQSPSCNGDYYCLYQYQYERNKKLILGEKYWREDTLEAKWVYFEKDPKKGLKIYKVFLPPSYQNLSSYRLSSYAIEDNLYRSLVLQTNDSADYDLFRMRGDSVILQRKYPYTDSLEFEIATIHSTLEGEFYLGGRVPGAFDYDAFMVHMDSTGSYKTFSVGENFDLHFNESTNQLRIFWNSAPTLFRYTIIDASGRLMQKGDLNSAELVSIGNWKTGIYYLQLFKEENNYLGTKSFLKP
jgi:hypothetical protein